MVQEGDFQLPLYYLGMVHKYAFDRRYQYVSIADPLRCIWFTPLARQSKMRFRLLEMRGTFVTNQRYIDDKGVLNNSDPRAENRFKTGSRVIHNTKLEFILMRMRRRV